MTLREIYDKIYQWGCYDSDFFRETGMLELQDRIEFIEQLIEDGLDLENQFIINHVWQGEPNE